MTRKAFVIKNVFAKWIGIFLITILQFISRRFFIIYFSDDLLGLSGLLQSVIAMLSLLELGVGSAIYYSLYEPLARNNTKKIAAIMELYKRIYIIIGITVLILGLAMLPLLSYFIDTELAIGTVRIAFCILLSDTVLSYFMAYTRNIFNADQKEYFCTNIDTITTILAIVTQVIVTLITNNYYLYLAGKVIWTIVANLVVFLFSYQKYPYLKRKSNYKLSVEYMREFKKNVKTLCISNISTYLVFSTDNILISRYVGFGSVFIYSNYSMIISAVNKLFHNIFNSAQASVGNYVVNNDTEKSYMLFENIFFVNYLITGFTSVSLITMFNSFMKIWLGEKYVWPIYIVAVLVINNYLRFINQTVALFRNAIGLYNPYRFYKYWGFVEGGVNLVTSLVLIKIFKGEEIVGVFLGTTISTALVFSFVGTHALFKYYFGIDKLKSFVRKYFIYLSLTALYSFTCVLTLEQISIANNIIKFIIATLISLVVPNTLNFVIFRGNNNFAFLKRMIISKVKCSE